MVSISLPGYTHPIDSRIIGAINEPAFASEFPFQRDMNTGNTVRFTAVSLSELFLMAFVSGDRSALAGYKAPLETASAPVRPPPTLDRIILTARTYTFCFELKLRSFLRQPAMAPRLLLSMESSLGLDPLVSSRVHPWASPFVYRV